FRGTPVRSPAGVANAIVAVDGVEAQHVFEITELPRGAAYAERCIVAVDGQARRVIAAIFEALQAIENNRNGALRAHIADNSAHGSIVRIGTWRGSQKRLLRF